MKTTSSSRRRTVIALLAVAALLVGVVGVVSVAITRAGGNGAPVAVDTSPTLTLTRTTNSSGQEPAVARNTVPGGAAAGYQLTGTLGTDTTVGVVIDPSTSTATAAQVTALLVALGMKDPAPKQVAGGWTASGTAHGRKARFALDEKAGNVWQYQTGDQADCLSINPGAAPDTAVSCAVTVPPVSPVAPAGTGQPKANRAGPGKAALVKAASGVFALVGVTPGTGLVANDSAGVTYLDIPLTVESLPVVDVNLSISADNAGITYGFGWLKPTFATVGKYPLISARAGFDALAAQPVPAIALAPVCLESKSCAGVKPQKVTAARLAWLTSRNGGDVVLVPAWQYEVDGFYGPAVVAVAPKYLATPSPVSITPGGGSASSEPGSTGASDLPATPNGVSTAKAPTP